MNYKLAVFPLMCGYGSIIHDSSFYDHAGSIHWCVHPGEWQHYEDDKRGGNEREGRGVSR